MIKTKYINVNRFSKSIKIPVDNLIKAFEIEKLFHEQILKEKSFEKRQKLYKNVYNTVHPLYGKEEIDIQKSKNPKDKVVRLFRKELEGKSILDVGCGEGYFLESVSRNLKHKDLVGIDVSTPHLPKQNEKIEFISSNIVRFDIHRQFDVVFSDQVLEHIAPADLTTHLASIRTSLISGGLLIINLPNRLFGPNDVTRIIDFSYTGKTKAQGTHLNESTYGEIISVLESNGFRDFRTVLPIPKLKHIMTSLRINPSLLQFIENSPLMLKTMRRIKLHNQCIARFGITLICNKIELTRPE